MPTDAEIIERVLGGPLRGYKDDEPREDEASVIARVLSGREVAPPSVEPPSPLDLWVKHHREAYRQRSWFEKGRRPKPAEPVSRLAMPPDLATGEAAKRSIRRAAASATANLAGLGAALYNLGSAYAEPFKGTGQIGEAYTRTRAAARRLYFKVSGKPKPVVKPGIKAVPLSWSDRLEDTAAAQSEKAAVLHRKAARDAAGKDRPSASVTRGGAFQPDNPRWWFEKGLELAPQWMAQMALGYATGGMGKAVQFVAFASPVFALEAGGAHNEAAAYWEEQGLSAAEGAKRAAMEAAVVGVASTALEFAPFEALFDSRLSVAVLKANIFKRVPGAIVKIGLGAGGEAIEEVATEAAQDTIAYLRGDKGAFEGWGERYPASGALGALGGGAMGSVRAGVDTVTRTIGGRGEAPVAAPVRPVATPERVVAPPRMSARPAGAPVAAEGVARPTATEVEYEARRELAATRPPGEPAEAGEPVAELPREFSDKDRRREIRKVRQEIETNMDYLTAAAMIEDVDEAFPVKKYVVAVDRQHIPQEITDYMEKIGEKGGKAYLWRYLTTLAEPAGKTAEGWDVWMDNMGLEPDIGDFIQRLDAQVIARRKVGGIYPAAMKLALEIPGVKLELLDKKLDLLREGYPVEAINGIIRDMCEDFGMPEEGIRDEMLGRVVEPVESARELKQYRRMIHLEAAQKGLGKKQLSDIKMKHGGARHLVGAKKSMGLEQLKAVYKAVQRARPRKIGWKRVVTQKTERKIQALRKNLIAKDVMTEADFATAVAAEVGKRPPKYVHRKKFITETEGKAIIRRALARAEILRETVPVEKAIAGNSGIQANVRKIDARVARARKRGARDPSELESMRHYMQQAEQVTGAPMYTAYQALINGHLLGVRERGGLWDTLKATTPRFKRIAQDKNAQRRISEYIASKSRLEGAPDMPSDITADEIKVARGIEAIFLWYRWKVRLAKFFNWYYYDQPIPDADRYAKEVRKAVDIYESQGKDALVEYVKTQEWGVIHSGYEPMQVAMPSVRVRQPGPTTFGKGHIKIRTALRYHAQDKTILQRLSSYMRQIDNLSELSPRVRALIQLFDDNMASFKNPKRAATVVETFLRTLKHWDTDVGFFARAIRRMYGQAMRTIILPSPALVGRNLMQNFAFGHDKSTLIDPRNKHLTDADREYLETFCLQTRPMIEEWFMLGQKPLPGLKFVTGLVDKVKIYPWSDAVNRHWGFWARKNQVDRAFADYTPKSSEAEIAKMMRAAKFNDMRNGEQRRALGILAKDGEAAMSRYVSRVYVDDVHFLYERAQRSPAEMGPVGHVAGNLMLFPRAYTEKLARQAHKVAQRKAPFRVRMRALKVIFAVVGGGLAMGAIYRKVTGRRRDPYNPLNIMAFRPGGLAWGTVEAVGGVYQDMLLAAQGDKRALNALTAAIPRAADMFIPFYDYTLRGFEAVTDQKNVDRLALRKMRELLDKEYKVRGGAYKIDRNALEKWQYFIAGAGVDVEIREREAQETKDKKARQARGGRATRYRARRVKPERGER